MKGIGHFMKTYPDRPHLTILGAPFGYGQRLPGLEQGPNMIREFGLVKRISEIGFQVEDRGNLSYTNAVDSQAAWNAARLVEETAFEIHRAGSLSLTLGGDHSIAVGTIRAALRAHPELRVVWIDAHGDMNTYETTISGNLHGMPLAALLGELPEIFKDPLLDPSRISLIGVRSLDPGETQLIHRLGIHVISAEQVQSNGVTWAMNEVNSKLGSFPLHVSIDIDSVDPSFAPATGLHVPEGLNPSQILEIAKILGQSYRIVSLDLVEINPLQTNDSKEIEKTALLGIEIITALLTAT